MPFAEKVLEVGRGLLDLRPLIWNFLAEIGCTINKLSDDFEHTRSADHREVVTFLLGEFWQIAGGERPQRDEVFLYCQFLFPRGGPVSHSTVEGLATVSAAFHRVAAGFAPES